MIEDFTYYAPTKVVFGRGAENKTGELVAELGCKKILLHYGGGSAERTGLLGRIRASLREADASFVELGGVVPNPRLSLVREGIELCRREGVDFILAVGGGSVIDSAKAIGYGAADEERGDVWDFYARLRAPRACLPVGSVLTIAAAGSEMSPSSVITNEDTETKRGYSNDVCRQKFAVMNPRADDDAAGLPDGLRLHRHSDAHDGALVRRRREHGADRRRSRGSDAHCDKETRGYLWRSRKITTRAPRSCGRAAFHTTASPAAARTAATGRRTSLSTSSARSSTWRTAQDSPRSGGSWARYVYKENPARFAKFAAEVLSMPRGADDEETALSGIAAMEDFYREIKMPVSIRGLGVEPSEAQIKKMSAKCAANHPDGMGKMKKLFEDDIERIFRAAM